jgi:hypothetical protein
MYSSSYVNQKIQGEAEGLKRLKKKVNDGFQWRTVSGKVAGGKEG